MAGQELTGAGSTNTFNGMDFSDFDKPKKKKEEKKFKRELFMPTHLKRLENDAEYAKAFYSQWNKEHTGEFAEQKKAADQKRVQDSMERSRVRHQANADKLQSKKDKLLEEINSGNLSSTDISSRQAKLAKIEEGLTKTNKSLEWFWGRKEDTAATGKTEVRSSEATPEQLADIKKRSEAKEDDKITQSTTTTKTTTSWTPNVKTSIVDLLKSKGQAASFEDRKKLASSYGIEWYEWTAQQNADLIKKVATADAKVLAERIKTWLANGTITEEQAKKWVEDIKKITAAADQKSKEELDLDKRTEEIKEENKDKTTNVSKTELEKTQEEFEENVEEATKKAADKITDAAEKESEAIEEKQKGASERVEKREEELGKKFDEFEENVEQRREDIEANTQRSRDIASRAANIAAAVAGQSWQSLSDGEVLSIQNDILRDYDTNISAAEQAAIKSNTELDQALRDTGITEFQQQDAIDKFKDSLDNEKNAPLIAAIGKVLEGDTKAIEDVKTFLNSAVAKTAEEQTNRANRIRRIQENEAQYEESTPEERVALLKDLTKGQAGAEFIGDEIRELVLQYPELSLAEIQSKVEKEAAYLNQRNIIANTISGKTYNDLGDEEKKAVDSLLGRGADAQERSDNTVEDTKEQKEELDEAQETAEEKKAREQAEAEAEAKQKEEADLQAQREKFNGFKDKKSLDKYNTTRKALQDKLKARVESIKKYKTSNPEKYQEELSKIEQIGRDGVKKLNEYKKKNTI